MKPRFIKYSVTEFKEAVRTATSIRQVLLKLHLAAYGASYTTINKAIKQYGLDTSHFTGQTWNKGRTFAPKKALAEYLVKDGPHILTSCLKRRLLKEGLLKPICACCNHKTWLGRPIPLELHHKDGDPTNNLLTNLELRCPNCHALTDNYRAKNKRTRGGTGIHNCLKSSCSLEHTGSNPVGCI